MCFTQFLSMTLVISTTKHLIPKFNLFPTTRRCNSHINPIKQRLFLFSISFFKKKIIENSCYDPEIIVSRHLKTSASNVLHCQMLLQRIGDIFIPDSHLCPFLNRMYLCTVVKLGERNIIHLFQKPSFEPGIQLGKY